MSAKVDKWASFEFSLSYQDSGNPFVDVTLEASFSHQNRQVQVHGF